MKPRTENPNAMSTFLRLAAPASLAAALLAPASADETVSPPEAIELGDRPAALAAGLPPGELRDALVGCDVSDVRPTPFSIGHRGAPLGYPEHTREGYLAAARQGAGIVECDVTFTADRELVCRHSQCDLHTTTNILETDLAGKCHVPPDPSSDVPWAEARCCASDLTLAEFRTLRGKADAGDPEATTLEAYLAGGLDPEAAAARGTLMTHAESIRLFDALGVGMTPELKEALVEPEAGADGPFTRAMQADRLLEEYRDAGIDPARVWPQSFEEEDVARWLGTAPDFAGQVVLLDDRYEGLGFDPGDPSTWSPDMDELAASGLRHLAPPFWVLVTLDATGGIVPSAYAKAARGAGLELIAWTLERSGSLAEGRGGWYFQSVAEAIDDDADALVLLDALAREVGVAAVFSDWPATTTFYAHCRG